MHRILKIIFSVSFIFYLNGPLFAQEDKVYALLRGAEEATQNSTLTSNILAKWLQVYYEIQDQKDHPEFVNVCISIGDIYNQENLYPHAILYYLEALPVLQKKPDPDWSILDLHQILAQTYADKIVPDSALLYYDKILKEKELNQNINGQINTLRDICKAFGKSENYEQMLDYNLKIKTLVEAHNYPGKEKAKVYNNIGYNYNQLNDYGNSIQYFKKALDLVEESDFNQNIILNTNIGVANYNIGQFESSLAYLLQAQKLTREYRPFQLDEINQLLATVYLKKGDLYNALNYNKTSQAFAKANQNQRLLTDVYYTAALVHSELYEYDLALDYFQRHLKLRDSFELEQAIRQQKLLLQALDLERKEKEVKLFLVNEDVKELTIDRLKIEKENQELALQKKEAQLVVEQQKQAVLEKEKELLSKDNEIKVAQAERARKELELAQQRLRVSEQAKAYSELQQQERLSALELKNKESELLAEKNENELLLRQGEISALEIQKQSDRNRFFLGLGVLLALIILIFIFKNRAIEKQKKAITKEREKSDGLLLNILPESVANELKETGTATTKKYDNVSILFTDFKDFTKLVASIEATTLVSELNDIFSRFDEIMEALAIEKIETIGDAYMAACGLPEENNEHALRCVQAAHMMMEFLTERNKTSEIQWRMRAGIHSGPVVAGVVGKKKFAYDLFGDTVNTASRMESNSEPGCVNVSNSTYELIKDLPYFNFENRGHIFAKGKGDMEMWFVHKHE